MPVLSVIIVNFNTRELLDRCVANLMNISAKVVPLEVIVVDNGSTDGSGELVKSKYLGKVTLVETRNNGLAVGNNTGLRLAKGDFILYLGTDAYPTEDALSKVLTYMQAHSDVGACTAKLVTRDGKLDMDAHRGFPTPWAALTHFSFLDRLFPKSKLFNQYFQGYKDFNVPHEIDLCISHFMMVKKEVHDSIGMWDESFFVFGEDVDMCYRIKEGGYKIVYLSDIEVLHYKGASIGRKTSKGIVTASAKSEEVRKILSKGRTNAMRLFYAKHMKRKYPVILTSIVLLGIFLLEKVREYSVKLRR